MDILEYANTKFDLIGWRCLKIDETLFSKYIENDEGREKVLKKIKKAVKKGKLIDIDLKPEVNDYSDLVKRILNIEENSEKKAFLLTPELKENLIYPIPDFFYLYRHNSGNNFEEMECKRTITNCYFNSYINSIFKKKNPKSVITDSSINSLKLIHMYLNPSYKKIRLTPKLLDYYRSCENLREVILLSVKNAARKNKKLELTDKSKDHNYYEKFVDDLGLYTDKYSYDSKFRDYRVNPEFVVDIFMTPTLVSSSIVGYYIKLKNKKVEKIKQRLQVYLDILKQP